ncbi:MAG TPA: hypothetical protein VIX13_03255 [Candidatus Eisenbacteria bacterium]
MTTTSEASVTMLYNQPSDFWRIFRACVFQSEIEPKISAKA